MKGFIEITTVEPVYPQKPEPTDPGSEEWLMWSAGSTDYTAEPLLKTHRFIVPVGDILEVMDRYPDDKPWLGCHITRVSARASARGYDYRQGETDVHEAYDEIRQRIIEATTP